MTSGPEPSYGRSMAWRPERPRWRAVPAGRLLVRHRRRADGGRRVLPGVDIASFWGALLVAVVVAALNAVIPPVIAALRLPLTLVLGFLLVLIADALILLAADRASPTDVLTVDNFWWALLAALVVAAVSVVLAVIFGTDDTTPIRIAQRIARRQGIIARPTSRGSSTSRSTGWRCRCCAARCATATRRTWPAGWPRTRTG